ncbi:MAG: hypothetical protein ABSD38_12935 [Syntrophorhabdales bacterium]|jgi:hypothetical protein
MNVAVIDIGHKTLDMVYFSKGDYLEKSKHTTELGVSRELDEIIQLERSRPKGRKLTYAELVSRMDTNKGLVTPGHECFVAGADDCLRAYTRTVLSVVASYAESLQPEPDLLLVGGGGARFLTEGESYDTRLYLVDHAESANAIGYYHWAVEVGI